ncbi:MAG: histone deacetylase [Gemmatimonadetes bacterium]|nr:histone deacetylase [Gemmatimonadota bacterium]
MLEAPASSDSPRRRGRCPVIWSEAYQVDIGPHVFPTAKYRLVKEQLLREGTIRESDLVRPEPATEADVARVHSRAYLGKIREGHFTPSELWMLEVPFSDELRRAAFLSVGGTLLAGREALETGIAVHLGGGFHHAFPDHGEGFCLLNDVAVAARAMMAEGRIERAAVVDLDVHHGNGTAAIFAGDPRVFTFSMHQEHNYPAFKPPGDLDIGLDDGTGDEEYLRQLRQHLPRVVEGHRPELVFYLAGADPYREDQLGGLTLTKEGLCERDEYVLHSARDAGVCVAVTLAGGYARRTEDTVEIHCNTVAVARAAAERR